MRKRVLFSTPAGLGHIYPTVPLARAMLARGDDVLWAVPPDGCEAVKAAGVPVVAVGTAGLMDVAAARNRYPELRVLPTTEMLDIMFGKLFGVIAAPVVLADLSPLARSWRPDLLVADAADFAGHVVAAEIGIPSVTKAFGPLLPERRVAAAGRDVEPLWLSHGLEPRPYGGAYDHLYVDIFPDRMQAPQVDHIAHRQLMRPVIYSGSSEPAETLVLPGGPKDAPLVYVTLGTVFNGPDLLEQLINAVAALDVRVLATLGPGADRAVLSRHANVRVERYIPQTLVLPRADVVVSHAGSGTVVATLSHGLPQLCLPQGADQFLNADAVRSAGAGIELLPGDADPDAVREAVLRLTREESFRSAAARIGESIAAMPSPDHVAGILESLP